MKRLLGILYCGLGLEWLVRTVAARRRATIVVYHDPDPATLGRHLAWLGRRYSFVTLDALADALESGRWDRLPRYPLVVTIDDGHRRNRALAPILHAHGVRPMVYLCSRIVGTARPYWWRTEAARRIGVETLKRLPDADRRAALTEARAEAAGERQSMTWTEARSLQPLCDFGAHTATHPILPRCDDRVCRDEIVQVKAEIESFLAHPCRHFAYPNGDAGVREREFTRAAGYRTARSIDPGWNGPETDRWRLKAMAVSDDASVEWLAVQISGLPAALRSMGSGAWGQVLKSRIA